MVTSKNCPMDACAAAYRDKKTINACTQRFSLRWRAYIPFTFRLFISLMTGTTKPSTFFSSHPSMLYRNRRRASRSGIPHSNSCVDASTCGLMYASLTCGFGKSSGISRPLCLLRYQSEPHISTSGFIVT